jgi:hypothetical protein
MMESHTSFLPNASYHHRWALLIGINHYPDTAIRNLKVCVNDVQAIYNLLTASGYESDRMQLLLAPSSSDHPATRSEILAALTSLAEAADESDLLLFYFSGHGMAYDGQAYILPTDVRYSAIADTAINLNRVKQIIQESAARAKIIILDACHSGAQIGKAPAGMTEEFMRHVFGEAEGIAILASCKQKQVSWEWSEKGRSVFTHYFLEGLQGEADFDQKGFVTVNDISRYVTDKVKTWSVQQSQVQTPTLQYTVAGDIILVTHSVVTNLVSSKNRLNSESKSKNPFIYGRSVRRGEFLNREIELRTIFNRLRNGESMSIVGEPRIGKTSLLLKIADEESQKNYLGKDAKCLIVCPLDLHPISNDYTPVKFWTEILEPLQERPEITPIARQFIKKAVETNYTRRSLEQLFNHIGNGERKLVLLLDEFDQLLNHPHFQASFFALLRSLATRTGGLALVTASRLSVAEMNERGRALLDDNIDYGSPFFNNMIDIHLGLFDEPTIDEFLNLAGDVFSLSDRGFIQTVAGRHPFLLQTMAAMLFEANGDSLHARAAERFYSQIVSHFDDLWYSMDDRTRTTAVIFSLFELGKPVVQQHPCYKEIEQIDAFGSELRKLVAWGLVARATENEQTSFLWCEQHWTIETKAFAWWIYEVVISNSRRVAAYDEWLTDKQYRILLTQEQWDWLLQTIRDVTKWARSGIGVLAQTLFEEISEEVKQNEPTW